jgi:hypothetical protein
MNIPPELAPPPLIRHEDSALHDTAGAGNTIDIALLIEQGIPVDATNTRNHTPLHVAAQRGEIESVTFLINAGANPNAQDFNGHTPLHWAILFKYKEAALALIANNTEVDATDYMGQTALHLAAENGDTELVLALIEKGADVLATDQRGNTPLHFAAANGHTSSVITLIEHGATVNARSRNNFAPLHYALSFQHTPRDLEIEAALANPLVREFQQPHEMETFQSTQKLTTALALLVYGKAYPHDITDVEENPIRQYIVHQYDLAQSEASTRLTQLAKGLFPAMYTTALQATNIAILKLYARITNTTDLYLRIMQLLRLPPRLPPDILPIIMGYMFEPPTLFKLDFAALRAMEIVTPPPPATIQRESLCPITPLCGKLPG